MTPRWLAHAGAALLAVGAAPLVLAGLALRPAWREGWRERLGRVPRLEPGAVWIHGASVGEALAALRLHDALAARGRRTLASTMTAGGQRVLAQRRPGLARVLAPVDHPWCAAGALERLRPAALVLIETELWPGWIAAAARRGIPVALVSARLSDRSFPRYRRLAFAVAPTLRRLAGIGARSREDAERFAALGAPRERLEVTGDLKLEPAPAARLAPDLEAALAALPCFVAGSTHAGEEAAALEALAAAEAAGHAASLVLAPRHVERAGEVEALARAAGRAVRRRSRLGPGPLGAGEVLVLDSVGELAAVYAHAAVAFVGGSLAPRGGHNVLEPVQAGRPVLFGPHTGNAREGVALVLESGAGRRIAGRVELARELCAALAHPEEAARRGARGRAALEGHRGAAERSAALVERCLAGGAA